MSLSADSIIDRIKLKEQITKWRAGTIILAVLLGLLVVTKRTSNDGVGLVQRDYIASITVEGLIQQDSERDEILQTIGKNKNIKAVILNVNSPGGTMVGSELLYKRIKHIAEEKPVVAVMQEVAASGGYMAAIAAPHVLAQQGTITGSIGVLFQTAEVTEMASKLGIELNTFKSSPLKGSPSPLEKITPAVERELQTLIKANYDIFVDIVKDARNISKDELLPLADGRVYTGTQAVENTLIDGIGGEDEAKEWLKEQDKNLANLPVKKVKLYREKNRFGSAFSAFIGWNNAQISLESMSLNGVLALWKPAALSF